MAVSTIKFSQFGNVNYANTTNMVVGVTAATNGTNYKAPAINNWTTTGRPSAPATGTLGYNTSLSQYEYYNGAAWVQLAAGGSGTVGLGGAGQLAYYNVDGTAVEGLLGASNSILASNNSNFPFWLSSAANALLATNGSSVPSLQTTNVVTNTLLAQMPSNTIKGNNTDSTADALDLTTSQVLTMLGINSNQSLTLPGYIQFAGGLIMQWTTGTSNGSVTYNWPTAFPNACFVGFCTPENDDGINFNMMVSRTTFTLEINLSDHNPNFFVLGIGY